MTPNRYELATDELRRASNGDHLGFETTQDISFVSEIIGQPRGVRAIQFGIGIGTPGFNIYVLGPSGSGRTTAVKKYLERHAASGQVPPDWVYVYNFEVEHQPRAIELPPGLGARLRDDMAALIDVLRRDIPQVLEAEEFNDAIDQLDSDFSNRRGEIYQALADEAKSRGFAIVRTPSGLVVAPLTEDGQGIMEPDAYNALPKERHDAMEKDRLLLEEKLLEGLRRVRELDREHADSRAKLERGAAAFLLVQHLGDLREKYEGHDEVLLYLNQVRDDVLDHLSDFKRQEESSEQEEGSPPPPPGAHKHVDPFHRYRVNLLVDHGQAHGAPVILEEYPSYSNLVGRIEGEVEMGALHTDFMGIKAGALHRANGGYLVLRARDVLSQPDAWEGLKRALLSRQIRIEESMLRTGLGVLTPQTIDPEPIPLNVKVVLLGTPALYYILYAADEHFPDLFKVKADFASVMERTAESEMDYASFIAARCVESGLPHFNRAAVGQVIEYGSRLADDRTKLSTLFGNLTDLIQEAAYWAKMDGASIVDARHVVQAIEEARYRANLYEERTLEYIHRGLVFIDTTGEVLGQVNALSVVGLGDYVFGQPNRITARVYSGKEGVVDIEREVELSGPIHNKGVLILRGYLGGQYAAHKPLALTASITFEQTYAGVEGDSASVAELFALLSALSGFPLKQSIAVTGSVNQRGQMQPVGGINEKIEGFFDVCRARGLTGDQGVIIPRANLTNLMLRSDVVDAVREGQFHVYAVETVDEGIELLTGKPAGSRGADGYFPAGTVHAAAQARLDALAEEAREWYRVGLG